MFEPKESGHADEETILDGGFSGLLATVPAAEPEPLLQLMEELLADLRPADAGGQADTAALPPEPEPPQASPGSSLLSLAGIVEALGDVAVTAPVNQTHAAQPAEATDPSTEPDFPPEFDYKAPESDAKPEPRALTLDSDDEEPQLPLLPGFAGKPSALSGLFEALLESSDSEAEADPEPEAEPEAAHPVVSSPVPTELTALIESMEQEVIQRAPAEASPAPAAGPAEAKAEVRESCIVFGLDGTRYAVPMRNVTEIDTLPRVTPVPHTPEFVRGVTNRRGEVVCVLDLRVLLGLEQSAPQPRQRILVMRTSRDHAAAMVVDEVRGTIALAMNSLPGPLGPVSDRAAELLAGVSQHQEQILNVLDVEKLFALEEMRQLTGSGEASR